jgi:hypothetical protein
MRSLCWKASYSILTSRSIHCTIVHFSGARKRLSQVIAHIVWKASTVPYSSIFCSLKCSHPSCTTAQRIKILKRQDLGVAWCTLFWSVEYESLRVEILFFQTLWCNTKARYVKPSHPPSQQGESDLEVEFIVDVERRSNKVSLPVVGESQVGAEIEVQRVVYDQVYGGSPTSSFGTR